MYVFVISAKFIWRRRIREERTDDSKENIIITTAIKIKRILIKASEATRIKAKVYIRVYVAILQT